jgi:hypothetical protein
MASADTENGHYEAALYLSSAAALATCLLWALIFPQRGGSIIFCAIALLIPFGLWVQSRIARYGGVAFMMLFAGALIWPLLTGNMSVASRQPLLAVLFLITAALNLLAAGVLVFSKRFGVEFAEERKRQPAYKVYLKRSVAAVAIVAMLLATVNDIINLATQ